MEVAFLILLGLSTYESIFGLNCGTKIGLFERHKSKISNAELFLMGTALSTISAFIVFVLLRFYGKNLPSFLLGTEENSFTAYYKVAITAPVFEEFLFRFMFLLLPLSIYHLIKRDHGLKQIYDGKIELETSDWIAILLTAIIFGLAHIGWAQWFRGVGGLLAVMLTYWKIAQAMGMGVLLGYSASRYGILASIAIHWAMNSLSSSM
nr:CPBP family intramembrane metalloprotease [Candidatus Korarchaeota archaeon]NIU84625.1 CPBP family intramembrane metalloprotease [Candidatus Thorarchaeota archaeon]NIW12767.1 CPBP family intramembrane metalloprotease [Candidatus Thorarchaeota archaeon]NIW50974.1 CPBP family intramembrane metalloprotease [Candidatus Korarchaeota archaeon]